MSSVGPKPTAKSLTRTPFSARDDEVAEFVQHDQDREHQQEDDDARDARRGLGRRAEGREEVRIIPLILTHHTARGTDSIR